MKDNLLQHVAQSPIPSPNGSRQDGHSGGKATSSTTRKTLRNAVVKRETGGATPVFVQPMCIVGSVLSPPLVGEGWGRGIRGIIDGMTFPVPLP